MKTAPQRVVNASEVVVNNKGFSILIVLNKPGLLFPIKSYLVYHVNL